MKIDGSLDMDNKSRMTNLLAPVDDKEPARKADLPGPTSDLFLKSLGLTDSQIIADRPVPPIVISTITGGSTLPAGSSTYIVTANYSDGIESSVYNTVGGIAANGNSVAAAVGAGNTAAVNWSKPALPSYLTILFYRIYRALPAVPGTERRFVLLGTVNETGVGSYSFNDTGQAGTVVAHGNFFYFAFWLNRNARTSKTRSVDLGDGFNNQKIVQGIGEVIIAINTIRAVFERSDNVETLDRNQALMTIRTGSWQKLLNELVQGLLNLSATGAGRVLAVNDVSGTAAVEKFAIDATGNYYVNGVKVLGAQQPAVTSPTGGITIDLQARTSIDDIRARLTAMGITV